VRLNNVDFLPIIDSLLIFVSETDVFGRLFHSWLFLQGWETLGAWWSRDTIEPIGTILQSYSL
jgi:hypothetical protein